MAIVVGNTGSGSSSSNASSYSFSFNNNKDYVIGYIAFIDNAANAMTATATYNGTSMTELATETATTSSRQYRVYLFGLDNAASGANTMAFSISLGVTGAVYGAICVSGQMSSPLGNTATNTAGCTCSITTSKANSLIVCCAGVRSNTTPPTLTKEANDTQVFNTYSAAATTEQVGAGSYRLVTTATSYTVGFTASGTTGDIACAAEIKEDATPTVSLSSPNDTATISDTTPDLVFTGTDGESNDVRYNLQIATSSVLEAQTKNAVHFDGSGDYGEVANFAGIDALTDGTLTIEGWVNQDTSGSPQYATFWDIGTDSTWIARLQTNDGGTSNTGINFGYLYSGTDADGYQNSVMTNGVWTHLAVVFQNGQKAKVYINGTEMSYSLQQTPGGTVQSLDGARLRIARINSFTIYDFKGLIGGFVRVWKTARTGTQINDNKNKHITGDSDLIINLKFLEGSGSTIDNEATSGADMTLTGDYYWDSGPTVYPTNYVTNAVSGTDAGFAGSPDNSDPFASAQAVTYTVQSALSSGTYYWRVRGIDPSGSNSYGAWSTSRSFTISSASAVTIQKTVKYCVKTTPAAPTKSLKYTVKKSVTAITKSDRYAVRVVQPAVQKTAVYKVKKSNTATKQLKYVTITTASPVQKSLVYRVAKPTTVQKGLVYKVNKATTVQKGLVYKINKPITVTKQLKYCVLKSASITKQLKYSAITVGLVQKSSAYFVVKPTTATKQVIYKVRNDSTITKQLKYVVISAASPIQKSAKYTVITTGATTKQVVYKVIKPVAITKQLIYEVDDSTTTSTTIEKSQRYAVVKPTTINKGLVYTARTSSTATKQVTYRVVKANQITKSQVYMVRPSPVVQKTLRYIVVSPKAPIEKSVKYCVFVTTTPITKQVKYGVRIGNTIQKSLTYDVTAATTAKLITKRLKYIVSGQKPKIIYVDGKVAFHVSGTHYTII